MEPWSRGAVEPWSRGAVEPWSRGAIRVLLPHLMVLSRRLSHRRILEYLGNDFIVSYRKFNGFRQAVDSFSWPDTDFPLLCVITISSGSNTIKLYVPLFRF